MSDCATTDCPVPQECDGTACLTGAPAGCPTLPGCDEWPDGACHAHCYDDGDTMVRPDGWSCASCNEEMTYHGEF